jgi:predicted Zn-dependent protease
MPGGKIAVYTGIIDKLKLTDDELAAIMGHEIAHALREHGRERASRAAGQGLLVSVVGAATGIGDGGQQLANMALQVAVALPNSRTQETEADRIGVELAARAGYDPRAAVTLWQKMGALSGGASQPGFLSTHPSHAQRIDDLRDYSARVMPLYQAAPKA